MEKIEQHIESIIFSSDQPVNINDIKVCLEKSMDTKIKKDLLDKAMENLTQKYAKDDYSFEIVEIRNGYQFLTKGAYHHTIGTLLKQNARKRLSKAALETLSIIAYKQPVTKSQAERIRGVSCDYSIQKLLEKDLVAISGRSEGPGRPLLYKTSEKFMDYFGLKSMQELPKLKEFTPEENTIGEMAEGEELIASPEANADEPDTKNQVFVNENDPNTAENVDNPVENVENVDNSEDKEENLANEAVETLDQEIVTTDQNIEQIEEETPVSEEEVLDDANEIEIEDQAEEDTTNSNDEEEG